jgi:RHS repeat-associated protein
MQSNYKHFTLLVFFCLWATTGWGQQPSYTLQTNESGSSKEYVAGDFISLKPGFSYAASGTNRFIARIDASFSSSVPTANTYAMPDGTITTDPKQGGVVGSIAGSASVSPTGGATYQIPIEVPIGINGMQPQVSITYNSQGGFGALGTGWDLSGSSVITRGPKTMYFDGQNERLKFDNTDPLYLDGQRLILLSGSPLTVGAVYATETEDYTRVTIAESNASFYTDKYFIVTTKDGKTMEYGNESSSIVSNSRNVNDNRCLAWKLHKSTDTYGNSIVYTYSDYGQYLQKIEYAGQSVEFMYVSNTVNPKNAFSSDFQMSQNKLLSTITTKSGSTILKTFGLNYSSDNRFTSVSKTAEDNTKVNSTMINWGVESNGITQVDMGNNPDVSLGINKGSIYTGDVDGDGYPDRIEMWPGASSEKGHISVYLFDKNTNKFSSAGTTVYFDYHDPDIYKPKMTVSDIDNDGKDEMILVNWGIVQVYKFNFNLVSLSTDMATGKTETTYGDPSITLKTTLSTSPIAYHAHRDFSIISTNVNHDQYNDIVLIYNNYNNNGAPHLYPGYKVFDGSSTGLIADPNNYFFNDDTYVNFQVGDFNADGKIDVLGLPTNSGTNEVINDGLLTMVSKGAWYQNDISPLQLFAADFNGDGLSDILAEGSNHIWRISENARGFDVVPAKIYPNFSGSELYLIDFNGDGLVDVVTGKEVYNGSTFDHVDWSFYKNIGGTFNTTADYQLKTYNAISKLKGFVTDVNGDGVADLILPDGNKYIALTMLNATRRNLVTGITNGMGQTNSFTYKNFSNFDQSDYQTNIGVVRNMKAPAMLVDTQTEPNGSVTTYSFEKPKYHIEGKGFLGFTTVTSTNSVKNVKMISEYEIEPTYFRVNLKKQTITTTNDLPISSLEQTNAVKVIDSDRKRYIPITTEKFLTDVLTAITQTNTVNYDAYPNAITETTSIGNLVTTVVTNLTGPSGKIPYLPGTITRTRTQDSQTATRITNYVYEYDVLNKYKIVKTTETTDPNDENQVVNVYNDVDVWGHFKTVSVSTNGKTRSTMVAYTTSGRFVASRTNALGQTTAYDWDETRGLLNSETDYRNNTTNYKYDSWGQTTEMLYPTGIQKVQVLQWASPGNAIGAKYYAYNRTSGTAPTTVWYDALGRELQKDSYGLNAKKRSVSTEYYADGKNYRTSEPYFEEDAAAKTWAKTYTYDEYGRPVTLTTPMGTSTSSYAGRTTSLTTPEGTQETVLNTSGQTLTSKVNGKMVTYSYYPSGLTKTSSPESGQALTMEYNLQGKRTKLIDPDGGTVESKYNGFGDLLWEKQKVHNSTDYVTTINNYDDSGLGLLQNTNRNGEVTTYTYDPTYKNRVNSIELAGKNKQTFSYDAFDRITNVKEEIGTQVYNTAKEYDTFGRVKKETYPSGYYTENIYDSYGNQIEVKDGSNRSIWKVIDENARGQLLHASKGGKVSTYDFDERGLPTGISADGVVKAAYSFDTKGNLEYRTDELYANNIQKEMFQYDGLNRLTNWDVYKNGALVKQNSMSYDATTSNITSKSDLGGFTMGYGGSRQDGSAIGPHALTTISGVPANFPQSETNYPTAELKVTYTDFKKIATLSEKNKYYTISYGVDDQRRRSDYSVDGNLQLTRYYLGDYEEEVDNLGNTKKIHYLSGGAMMINRNGVETLYYGYSDYQGSLIALTDENGTVVERYAYDPWGARRNPDDWTQKDSRTTWIVNRGYTGHEHLDAFGIINMNGRVYDPLTAQFFSPDPYVQAPDNWLNYNRYGYCFGNPFRYTDPTGLLTWNDIFAGFSIITGIILFPVMPALGTSLIVAGFTHFALTIDYLQDASHNGQQMSWNQASNKAGFQFSTTISINKPDSKEINLLKGNPKKSNGDYNSVVSESVYEGVESSYNAENNKYYLPSSFSVSDIHNVSVNWSKDINAEVMVYYTTKGWYFEKIEGTYRQYDNGFPVESYFQKNGLDNDGNQVGGAYSLYYSWSEKGNTLTRNSIHPTLDHNTWATLLWSAHPHPFNNAPSRPDRNFALSTGKPVFTWGWGGNDEVTTNNLIYTIDEYYYFNNIKK